MICPYCGQEMEKGTLHSRGGNYFLPDGESASGISFPAKQYFKKSRAISLPPGPWELSPTWPVAYCCRSCQKLIIEYEQDQQ